MIDPGDLIRDASREIRRNEVLLLRADYGTEKFPYLVFDENPKFHGWRWLSQPKSESAEILFFVEARPGPGDIAFTEGEAARKE